MQMHARSFTILISALTQSLSCTQLLLCYGYCTFLQQPAVSHGHLVSFWADQGQQDSFDPRSRSASTTVKLLFRDIPGLSET